MSSDLRRPKTDEQSPKKSSRRILKHELDEADEALHRPANRLFISGLSAGLDLSLSMFFSAVFLSLADGTTPRPIFQLLLATIHAIGFVVVVLGRSELFTEQTSLAVLPLLAGKTTFRMVARLWGSVYPANLIGAAVGAVLFTQIGPALGVVDPRVFAEMGHEKTAHVWWVILLSGAMAGWLMGLLSWLVAAGRDTISQLFIVWMITAGIGLGHLHHSVLGTATVLGAIFTGGDTTWGDFGHFLLWTTLGNAIGGPLFVALLRHGQARAGEEKVKDE